MFGSSSSLPPLVGPGGGLVCESVGKADLLSDHFDSKQSWESVVRLDTYHPSPSLITFAFRSSEVKRLLAVRLGPLRVLILIGTQSVVQCGICPDVTFGLLTILWRF